MGSVVLIHFHGVMQRLGMDLPNLWRVHVLFFMGRLGVRCSVLGGSIDYFNHFFLTENGDQGMIKQRAEEGLHIDPSRFEVKERLGGFYTFMFI